jgi:hypothetical protein
MRSTDRPAIIAPHSREDAKPNFLTLNRFGHEQNRGMPTAEGWCVLSVPRWYGRCGRNDPARLFTSQTPN